MSWDFYGDTKPLHVKDGIKARSKRGAIGTTWWSKRFVSVLEGMGMGNRLQRGRNYARRGQLMNLDISPGAITARVQGSRPTPYNVSIELAPLTETQWEAVERVMASQARFLAQLLASEMPQTIETAFESVGHPLFPTDADALTTWCSCPDIANPCKHIAAAYYILAESFDEDPFLIFCWRGRSRAELLASLRLMRDSVALSQTEPLPTSLEAFYNPGFEPPPPGLDDEMPPAVPDLVIRPRSRAPITIGESKLEDVLGGLYAAFTGSATAIWRGDVAWERASDLELPARPSATELDEDDLLDALDEAYDALDEDARRVIFEPYTRRFTPLTLDSGDVVTAELLWRDKAALFDLLADESVEDLRAFLRGATGLRRA